MKYLRIVYVNEWIVRIICMFISWFVTRYNVLKKFYILDLVLLFDIICSVLFKIVPISLHTENYILVFFLLLCQLIIRTDLYKDINVEELKKV